MNRIEKIAAELMARDENDEYADDHYAIGLALLEGKSLSEIDELDDLPETYTWLKSQLAA